MANSIDRFDEDYYRKYYHDPSTRVIEPGEMKLLGDYVCSALRHLQQPVRRVLDLGCGIGAWQEIFAENFPSARYHGVEASLYLCEEYGWNQGSVVDWYSRRPFDMVICNDVIQYLDDAEAEVALNNLARLCRGVLYFGVLTAEDWEENCDKRYTETVDNLRPGQWYRDRLSKHFWNFGGGIFISTRASIVRYELEKLR